MEIDKNLLKKIKLTPLLDTLRLEKISDEIYFKDYKHKYISNSRLGLLKTKGVQVFFEGLSSSFNSSFEFGSNLHCLYLQPESFELIDSVYKPTAKAGIVADYLYNSDGVFPTDDEIKVASIKCDYYKDKLTTNRLIEFRNKAENYWRDRFLFEKDNPKSEKSRIYTDEKSVNLLKSCLNSINNNLDFTNLIHPTGIIDTPYSSNEQTILLDLKVEIEDFEDVIHLKAKLDNFTIDKENNTITVNDLKTTSRPANMFDPTYYSYNREIAFYSFLLKLCAKQFFGLENPKVKGNFLVVSTVPEYNSLIYPMTSQLFKSGWNEAVYLLKTACYYISQGYELQ